MRDTFFEISEDDRVAPPTKVEVAPETIAVVLAEVAARLAASAPNDPPAPLVRRNRTLRETRRF